MGVNSSLIFVAMNVLPGAPGRIRTRDPLLRRHTWAVARRRWVWPDRLFSCTDTGWTWPGVAQHMSPLAPQLAPRNPANVHRVRRGAGPCRVATQLRWLANCDTGSQARDYPRPKAATRGWDRPTLSTAAPVSPSALPVLVWPGPHVELAALAARHHQVTPGAGHFEPFPDGRKSLSPHCGQCSLPACSPRLSNTP